MAKAVLGKGLNALIPDSYKKNTVSAVKSKKAPDKVVETVGVSELKISDIITNPDQPRSHFDESALEELAASIKKQGVIQPVIVKKLESDKYELICGERRFRASQIAGLTVIPAVVKDISDDRILEVALIENIQRQDLNAVEEAAGYLRLYERGISHEEIAGRVGKSRTAVVNTMRLLKLPKVILQLIIDKQISEGHGRALLALPGEEYQLRIAKKIIEQGLSVRQVEDIVRGGNKKKNTSIAAGKQRNSQITDLETRIAHKLGSQVKLSAKNNKGKIEIKFFSLDELDRILSVIGITNE